MSEEKVLANLVDNLIQAKMDQLLNYKAVTNTEDTMKFLRLKNQYDFLNGLAELVELWKKGRTGEVTLVSQQVLKDTYSTGKKELDDILKLMGFEQKSS